MPEDTSIPDAFDQMIKGPYAINDKIARLEKTVKALAKRVEELEAREERRHQEDIDRAERGDGS